MAGGRIFHRIVNGKQQKTWTVQYDAPPDKTGKRKQKMKSGFKTKSEAQAFLVAIQNEINIGNYVEPSKMTFDEYIDYWLENYAKQKYRTTTYTINRIKLRNLRQLYPKVFSIRLSDLKPIHLQEIINSELAKGIKANSVKTTYALLRTPLNQAVGWEIIPKNPIDAVSLPKVPKTQVQSLNPNQVSKLLDATKGTRMHDFYYLGLLTGMRRGELLGLRWIDIDFESSVLHVRRTANYINGQGTVFQEQTKTESGMRSIAISYEAITTLNQIKFQQAKERLASGGGYQNEHGLVFTKEDGTPVSPLFVTKHFKRIMRKLGYEDYTLHCLRHTHATFLLSQGENPKLIAERLGHKDAAMTLNIYSHVLPNAQKSAADRLDQFLKTEVMR